MAWWRIEVSDDEGQIVAIEPAMLAGRDIGAREEETIRVAISHLLVFLGDDRGGPTGHPHGRRHPARR